MGCRFVALVDGKYFKAKWGAKINVGDYVSDGDILRMVLGVIDTVNIEDTTEFLHGVGMREVEEVDAVYVELDEDWRPTAP